MSFHFSQKQLINESEFNLQSYDNQTSEYNQDNNEEQKSSATSLSYEQVLISDSNSIQQVYLISQQPFSKKSGNFSKSQIVLFKKKLVFIKQIVSKYGDQEEIYKNEKKILQNIIGKDISLDLISFRDDIFMLFLAAGDKDLNTIKEIVEEESFYLDSQAYDQFITNIYIQVFKRLRRFHKLGYCHVDIKPSNIMMGYNGQFYLADFGSSIELAKNQKCKYMTNQYNFKQYANNKNLSKEQQKQIDFSQLLLTILCMYIFDQKSKEYFMKQQFDDCINYLLELNQNKNSEFLQKIKILIEFHQNHNIDSQYLEPVVYLEYLNHDMGLLDKLFDLQCSDKGIIFIKFIRDENLPLIDFLCKQDQIIELQNQCKIRTSCKLKDLAFLMKKLNIQNPQDFNLLWKVDYKRKKKKPNKNQCKIDQLTATIKQEQKVNFSQIQQIHDKLEMSVISISGYNEDKVANRNKLYNSCQIQYEKQIDVSKQINDVPKEIFDIIKYVITKVINQIISYENEQEFKNYKFVYLDFQTYQNQRESLNKNYFNQQILKENTIGIHNISNNESINIFIRKYQPFHLLQLIYQIFEETKMKYYEQFYYFCEQKEYFLYPIFLFEMANLLENNKSKIKLYQASYNDCIQRMNFHNNNLIPEIMQKLVDIYDADDQFNKSLEFAFRINHFFEIKQKCKNDEFVMRSKTNKAYAFMNVGKLRHSVQYFEEAIKFGKQRTNIREINVVLSKAYNHLAFMLQLLKSYEIAYKCSEESFKIRKQLVEENGSVNDKTQLGISYRSLGIIYIQLHKKPDNKIIQNFQKALALYVNCDDSDYFRLTQIDLSNALIKTKQFNNAQKVLDCGFTVYKTSSILIKKCIQEVNLIYKQQQNLDEIVFSSEEDMLSYIEMIHKLIKEKVDNGQINQKQKTQFERKINSLQEWQYELDYKKYKKQHNYRYKKHREQAIDLLIACVQNRENIFGEQYNMKIFKTCETIQKMCFEQKLYYKALLYTRKMLQILLYLIQSDKIEISNKQYPDFYNILIKQTLKKIILLYSTVGKKELCEQYQLLIEQSSPLQSNKLNSYNESKQFNK